MKKISKTKSRLLVLYCWIFNEVSSVKSTQSVLWLPKEILNRQKPVLSILLAPPLIGCVTMQTYHLHFYLTVIHCSCSWSHTPQDITSIEENLRLSKPLLVVLASLTSPFHSQTAAAPIR